MATVKLTEYECRKNLLPKVCMFCGEPAVERKQKNFAWHPPWVCILILVRRLDRRNRGSGTHQADDGQSAGLRASCWILDAPRVNSQFDLRCDRNLRVGVLIFHGQPGPRKR